jgi:hypothetical protein
VSDLYRTAIGIVSSHVLGGLVRLGVPDVLDDGGTTAAEAAGRVGVSEELLARLLRSAAALDAVVEVAPGRFALTASGRTLRRDDPSGTRALVQLINEPAFAGAWGTLEEQLRTGETAFDTANGEPLFAHLAGDPELQALFNAAMSSWTVRSTGPLAAKAGFERFGTVVDVGGGDGSLLAAVLAAHPSLNGIVFDTAEGAGRAPRTLEDAGVAGRCTVETGDFFAAVPAGGDAYVLKNVIHDWDDGKAAAILRNCRDALPEDGRVLVVETVLPDEMRPGDPGFSEMPYLFDIVMMLVVGGRERSRADYAELFDAAGLRLTDMVEASPETGVCVLEAVRA